MADIIEYTIFGDDLQMVEIKLDPGGSRYDDLHGKGR
jgi:hypothetical protein